MSQKTYKRIFITFYVLSVVLVASAVLDFFLFGHNYVRSQGYMAAAFVSAFVGAIAYRVQRSAGHGLVQVSAKVSAWVYVGVVAFSVFFALFTFTSLLAMPVVLYSGITTIILVVGKMIFDQHQVRSKSGFKLTLIHKIGIVFAVGVFASFVYLLIAELFNWNPNTLYL